jgi:hypothetical protein
VSKLAKSGNKMSGRISYRLSGIGRGAIIRFSLT